MFADPDGGGTFYVAVFGFSNSSYTILGSVDDGAWCVFEGGGLGARAAARLAYTGAADAGGSVRAGLGCFPVSGLQAVVVASGVSIT